MKPATLAGAGAIVLWAFLGLLSRAAAEIPPLQLTAMSFSVAAVLGVGVLAARGRLADVRQRPLAWLHGVGGLFGFHALYFTALALAPAAEANLINYSWPLLIVLLSAALLGLRLTPGHIIGTLLGGAGCVLLLGGGARLTAAATPGYVAAVASALTWATYSVLSRRYFSRGPTGAVAGFCAGSAALAATSHFAFEPTVAPSGENWIAVLALGAGPVGGAFFLWDIGMKRGDPRLLGTLAYATPVASTLLLCAGGFATFSATLLASAVLVAASGLVAARA
jgi:drug/metabolite transporter (DMT)-like permease